MKIKIREKGINKVCWIGTAHKAQRFVVGKLTKEKQPKPTGSRGRINVQWGVYVGGTSAGGCDGPAPCSPPLVNLVPES